MGQVNYWLVGVAFVVGLLLTFALTIRRVTREVPVRSSESKREPKNGQQQ
jgi:uncharacterized membrane protein ArfC